MKIAICYSGGVNAQPWTFNNHLLALLTKDVQLDVFAHFWKMTAPQWLPNNILDLEPIIKSSNKGRALNLENVTIKKIVSEKSKSKIFEQQVIENYIPPNRAGELVGPLDGAGGWPYRALSMFYGIGEAINLALQEEKSGKFKYDFIFRLRPDLVFIDTHVPRDLNKCDSTKLNVAPFYWEKREGGTYVKGRRWNEYRGKEKSIEDGTEYCTAEGVDDTIGWGNGEVMSKYAGVYKNYSSTINSGQKIFSQECLLGTHLENEGVEVFKTDWACSLVSNDPRQRILFK